VFVRLDAGGAGVPVPYRARDIELTEELVDQYVAKYKDSTLDRMYACLDLNLCFSDSGFPGLDGRLVNPTF
jgi:hypothetical protein